MQITVNEPIIREYEYKDFPYRKWMRVVDISGKVAFGEVGKYVYKTNEALVGFDPNTSKIEVCGTDLVGYGFVEVPQGTVIKIVV